MDNKRDLVWTIRNYTESIVEEICDNYCKYSDKEEDPELGCKRECIKCPLTKLL